MPSELLNRLNPFLDESPAVDHVMPAEPNPVAAPRHWQRGIPRFGQVINTVQSVVIHETSGWPSFESSNNFVRQFTSDPAADAGRLGLGPQIYIDANGTAFRLIDLDPTRLTWHASYLNLVSVGIENGDIGDANIAPNPAANPAFSLWRQLSTNAEDLSGLKGWFLIHPVNRPGLAGEDSTMADGVLIWFGTANYIGPVDPTNAGAGFHHMIFTERNYRTLVLTCRYLAELLGIPRNFPALPYEQMELNIDSVDNFRKIVLGDERLSMIARATGTTPEAIIRAGAPLSTWYTGQIHAADATFKRHNTAWRRMLDNSNGGGYRGFHGHGFAGDIFHLDNHTLCPGPFFDWHRFAREVWDWWWFPFDFTDAPPATATDIRPYRHARRATVLRDYSFDAEGAPADYQNLRNGTFFNISNQTPVYAMANGVLVAASMPTDRAVGLVLIRHEVFHQRAGDRIDYDVAPSYVYSLTGFLDNSFATTTDVSDQNPDWLNRVVIRLKETELAVALNRDHPEPRLTHAWARVPTGGGGARPSLGDQISLDAAAYRNAIDQLDHGAVVLFPLEAPNGTTPVRVVLGDYLGFAGNLDADRTGVLLDIFSVSQLPGVAGQQSAARYTRDDWWNEMAGFTALETDADKVLPADGNLWHYDVVPFLQWINGVTWQSEWPKYNVVDAANNPVPRPNRPRTRVIQ